MVLFDENPYYLEKLEVHKDTSIFDTTEHKPKQQHVPAWNHPWRRAFYEDYVLVNSDTYSNLQKLLFKKKLKDLNYF